jgi:hypothetical protein
MDIFTKCSGRRPPARVLSIFCPPRALRSRHLSYSDLLFLLLVKCISNILEFTIKHPE